MHPLKSKSDYTLNYTNGAFAESIFFAKRWRSFYTHKRNWWNMRIKLWLDIILYCIAYQNKALELANSIIVGVLEPVINSIPWSQKIEWEERQFGISRQINSCTQKCKHLSLFACRYVRMHAKIMRIQKVKCTRRNARYNSMLLLISAHFSFRILFL